MKCLLAIALCCLSFGSLYGQTSRALLVAVDSYPEGSGWNAIHAENDLSIVVPMLVRNGFGAENIRSLAGTGATKSAIADALGQLVRETGQGDKVYLHFSCHGQLMADDSGDEPDGYDEALIPYDAPRRYSKGIYEGGNHLRDDELQRFLDAIRRQAGREGRLTVVFDACHSGTGDRDSDDGLYARGTTYVFAPEGYEPGESDPKKVVWRMSTDAGMAPLTVMSACHADQINYEYKAPDGNYYGLLTYALCTIGVEAETTVTGFFYRLKARMAKLTQGRKRQQIPDLQTTHEDRPFGFGR